MSKEKLIGTWNLKAWEIRLEDGSVHHPMGDDAKGVLRLDPSGMLIAHLMKPGRPAFADNDILRGTPEEIVPAFQGYIAFWGDFVVDESINQITYTVEGSLFPNWIGHDQIRTWEFDGETLHLKTPPALVGGQTGVNVLVWERIS